MSLESVVDEFARINLSQQPDALRLHTAYEEAGSQASKDAYTQCIRLVQDKKEPVDVKIGALRVLDCFMDLEGRDMALYVCDQMKFFGQISKASKEVHNKMTKKPAPVILQNFPEKPNPKFSDLMIFLSAVNEFVDKWGLHYTGASTKARPSPLGAFETVRKESFKAGVQFPRFQEDYQYMCKPGEAPSKDALLTRVRSFRGSTEYGGLNKEQLDSLLERFKQRYAQAGAGNITTNSAREAVQRELALWQRTANECVDRDDIPAFEQISGEIHRANEILSSRPEEPGDAAPIDLSYLGAPPSNDKSAAGKSRKKSKRGKTPGSTSGSSAFEGFGEDLFGGSPRGDAFGGDAFGSAPGGGNPFGDAPCAGGDPFAAGAGAFPAGFDATEPAAATWDFPADAPVPPTPSFGAATFGHEHAPPVAESPSARKKPSKDRRGSKSSRGTHVSQEKAEAAPPAEDWYGGSTTPEQPEAAVDWYGAPVPQEPAFAAEGLGMTKKKRGKKEKSRRGEDVGGYDAGGLDQAWLGEAPAGAGGGAPPLAPPVPGWQPELQFGGAAPTPGWQQEPQVATGPLGMNPFGFGEPSPCQPCPQHPSPWESSGGSHGPSHFDIRHTTPEIDVREPALPDYEESGFRPRLSSSPMDIKVEQQARTIESLESSLHGVREEFQRMQERKSQLEDGIDRCNMELRGLHARGQKATTQLSEQAIILAQAKQRLASERRRREELEGELQTKSYLQRSMRGQVRDVEAQQELHDQELVREWKETLSPFVPHSRGNVRYGSGAGDGTLGLPSGGSLAVHQSDELATAMQGGYSGSDSPSATSRSRVSTTATSADDEPEYLPRTLAPDWIRTPHMHRAPSAIAARIPTPAPALVQQADVLFRNMLGRQQGWFYEDEHLALAVSVGKPLVSRPQTSTAALRFEVLIANRGRHPIHKVLLQPGPQNPLYGVRGSGLTLVEMQIQADPMGGQNATFSGRHGHPLSPGHKLNFRGELKARGPFEAGPQIELSYLLPDDQQCRSRLRLPITVARFMAPAQQVNAARFIALWTSEAYAQSEVAFLIPVRDALLESGATFAHGHLLELHGVFCPVPGVDESPWAATLASLYLQRSARPEVLVRAELGGPGGPLSAFDKRPGRKTDAEHTLCRVEVRSASQLVSRAVAQALLHLVASPPDAPSERRQ
mmetsp:Transcript_13569/g.30904  ORF Transcript_13569/g.30904 Transcript_13569/m.30904 type:complete len:1175 (-) Transcript_13569:88-3612(-)